MIDWKNKKFLFVGKIQSNDKLMRLQDRILLQVGTIYWCLSSLKCFLVGIIRWDGAYCGVISAGSSIIKTVPDKCSYCSPAYVSIDVVHL